MSKAFTKDDADDSPLVVPRRAPLPPGNANYVTPRGMALLLAELDAARRSEPAFEATTDAERARTAAVHAARLADLEQRVASAVVVESARQPKDEVRFGATVEVQNLARKRRRYQIVGVDEADAERGAIAFVAPLARSLLGKRLGDAVLLTTPSGEDELEILSISYE